MLRSRSSVAVRRRGRSTASRDAHAVLHAAQRHTGTRRAAAGGQVPRLVSVRSTFTPGVEGLDGVLTGVLAIRACVSLPRVVDVLCSCSCPEPSTYREL